MPMTTEQVAALRAAILADPALVPWTSGATTNFNGIVDAMNAAASPAVLAWRTAVPPVDSDDAPDMSTFDALTAGKRDSWLLFLGQTRDFSRNKVRKWVTDIWGNATAGSNAEAILQAATENCRRVEAVIGGTTKTTGTVSAIDRTYMGTLTLQDVLGMFNG